jgi:hypothetical protein
MASEPSREEFLKPYLDRLPSLMGALKAGDIPVGGRTVSITAWEGEMLGQALAGGPQAPWWQKLMLETVAFEIKLMQDLLAYPEVPEDPDLLPADSPLRDDCAVGNRLLEDLKAAVSERVLTGDKENYKQLSAFRNRLFLLMSEIRHCTVTAPGEDFDAEGPELDIGAPKGPTREERQASIEASIQRVQRQAGNRASAGRLTIREIPREELSRGRRRLALLLGVLAVAAAAAVLLLRPAGGRQVGKAFTRDDFRHIRAVAAVTATPPTVTLTLDPDEWDKVAGTMRRSIVTEIGNRVKAAGYEEAVLATPDGAVQGRWTAEGGVTLP